MPIFNPTTALKKSTTRARPRVLYRKRVAAENEKQKCNSIVEFCQEDAQSFVAEGGYTFNFLGFDPAEIWEAGKCGFAIELYGAEKQNAHQSVAIFPRDRFKICGELVSQKTPSFMRQQAHFKVAH